MPKPFFSIITCSYNSASFIEQNLRSVSNQNFRDFEHIVIDGLSQDGTLEICQKFSLGRDYLKISQAAPRGIANAMNSGIKQAQGEWLLFLNADDCLNNENVLKSVHEFINRHPTSWYYGQAKYTGEFNRRQNIYPRRWYHRHFFYQLLFFINFINHQAVFLNRRLFDKYGPYNEVLAGGLDYEYWFRIGKKEKPKFMPLLIADFHVGGFSTDPKHKEFHRQETIKIRRMYTRLAALTLWPMQIYQKIRHIK